MLLAFIRKIKHISYTLKELKLFRKITLLKKTL